LKADLDPELLRAFVAVVDGGGFTRAAERLHRTQSTVSQQIKRLEQRVDAPLFARDTRNVALTERGELLLGYARRLLALNDETLEAMNETRLRGRVRLGVSQEVADGGLAEVLARFVKLYSGVTLEVRVAANQRLREGVERGVLDMAVLFQEAGMELPGGEIIDRLRRVWTAAPTLRVDEAEPVPLVLYDPPCLFRDAALQALEEAGRPWRIALTTPSLSGIRAAVRAGLGVAVRTERWLEADVRVPYGQWPLLPDVELALVRGDGVDGEVDRRLRTALRDALAGAGA